MMFELQTNKNAFQFHITDRLMLLAITSPWVTGIPWGTGFFEYQPAKVRADPRCPTNNGAEELPRAAGVK